jgi:regulator of sigma E protease
MTSLIMAAQLILGLSILVTLHELGHFLAARAFGIRVEKFYIFFDAWGFKLFSFKKGDTEYGIGWLPLGGYVKISGMVDESLDSEQMKKEPQSYEFRSKPAWQRLIVMIAGVTMNVILGIAIFAYTLLHYTQKYIPNDEVNNKGGIYAYELGRQAGLRTGDRITAIDGKPFERFEDLLSSRILFGATLTVERDGQPMTIGIPGNMYRKVARTGKGFFIGADNQNFSIDSVLPGMSASKAGIRKGDLIVKIHGDSILTWGQMRESIASSKGKPADIVVMRNGKREFLTMNIDTTGFVGVMSHNTFTLRDYTLGSAIAFGYSDAVEALVSNAKGLAKLFTGEEKATDSVQGPIGIAQIYGGIWDWKRFWSITGLLSMVLAFMNILPIPALDGGHVIFLSIESVTRRKFSDRFMEKAQIAGMIILLALMAFALGNDIWKHVLN